MLLAVPNVSEGRDPAKVERLAAAFAPAALLDVHSDPDHDRSVFTLAAERPAEALLNGARAALELIDLREQRGLHPRVGALDVAPVVHLDDAARGAAVAEALTAANLIAGELDLPVFLYGALADGRERAAIRKPGLAERIASGEMTPDFGPLELHPTAGAVLVTARPPLIAFNVDLASDDVALAQEIAAEIREPGLPGVRAIGLLLDDRGRAQVSTNIHDHARTSPAAVVEAVAGRAEIAEAELVGLAPAAAFADFPENVPIRGLRTIEDALASER
ncbi:MAG: glutamate formiminotransferase [Thermoleophilaceae bacterium]|nr:glutamate formiminotransferase [Thermoleophilaceae bacterium]